ncbi:hypothetical protein CEXT_411331 [Caerostris extrusa]|uniref:Uncharacterized protein n=1 Tax=Caerostris extrusa TaxID=172846 RepID=A0AAV4XBQ3_CAEEX|nr:hypothetical protein CEXT_411331 [Caerostris extrusa]
MRLLEYLYYTPLTRCITRYSVPRDGSEFIIYWKLLEAYELHGVKRFHVNYDGRRRPTRRWNRICRCCPEYSRRE